MIYMYIYTSLFLSDKKPASCIHFMKTKAYNLYITLCCLFQIALYGFYVNQSNLRYSFSSHKQMTSPFACEFLLILVLKDNLEKKFYNGHLFV